MVPLIINPIYTLYSGYLLGFIGYITYFGGIKTLQIYGNMEGNSLKKKCMKFGLVIPGSSEIVCKMCAEIHPKKPYQVWQMFFHI